MKIAIRDTMNHNVKNNMKTPDNFECARSTLQMQFWFQFVREQCNAVKTIIHYNLPPLPEISMCSRLFHRSENQWIYMYSAPGQTSKRDMNFRMRAYG